MAVEGRMAGRVLNPGMLGPLEAVEQRSEIGGSVVHSDMLGQTALTLSKWTLYADCVRVSDPQGKRDVRLPAL